MTTSSRSPNILNRNPTLNAITLDFNQHIRFQYIIKNLKYLTKEGSVLKILDVGAGMGTLTNYLTSTRNCSIINVETTKAHRLKNQIIADGRHLPFTDEAFDVTISSDVLEHIIERDREAFLNELLRCTKNGVVLTFSQIHTKNPQRSAIRLFEILSRNPPQWYVEHNSNQLVEIPKTIITLQNNRAYVVEVKPIVGFSGVLFTGVLQNVPWRGHLREVLNIASYFIVKATDRSPYYGFGVTVEKNRKGREAV